jgi:Protein of unknown function (DUF1254)
MVVSSPDTNGRYFLLPMLDAWTDVFASPGWRTTGTQAQTFLIAPQNWRPDLRERLIEDFKLWRLRHDNVAALRLGGMVRKNDPRKFLARRRPAREAVTKQLIHPNRYTVLPPTIVSSTLMSLIFIGSIVTGMSSHVCSDQRARA